MADEFQMAAAASVLLRILETAAFFIIFAFQHKGLAQKKTDQLGKLLADAAHLGIIIGNHPVRALSFYIKIFCQIIDHFLLLLTNTKPG